jgi:hypothetical protein
LYRLAFRIFHFYAKPLFLLPDLKERNVAFGLNYQLEVNPQSAIRKSEIFSGAVAQLVEQRTENPCVGGSIPPHTTK